MSTFLKERREKFKSDMAQERVKLKEMSLIDKIIYIREYYFWQILFGGIAVAILIWALNFYIINPPPTNQLGISFYGQSVALSIRERVEDDMTAAFIENTDRHAVEITNFFPLPQDPEFDMAMTQQFFGMVASGMIDIIVAHPDHFPWLFANEFAMDLRLVFNEAELAELAHIVEYGFIINIDTATGQPVRDEYYTPFGLSLRYSDYFLNIAPEFEGWIMFVVGNSERLDNARGVIFMTVGQ